MTTATKTEHRPLSRIAREVLHDWKLKHRDDYHVRFVHAMPYVNAMCSLDQITDKFYHDSGQDVVLRFLVNVGTWRGEDARRIKAELKQILRANGYPMK